MPYRIAGREPIVNAGMVNAQSQFAAAILQLFQHVRPTRIIETGTYLGTGTTTVIALALRQLQIDGAEFFSIECNPGHHAAAVRNLNARGLVVRVGLGLSVPRRLLPSPDQIRHDLVENEIDGVFVDHEPEARVQNYSAETNFPQVKEDLLGACLKHFDFRPHFLLLDSAGHMGHIEFNYVVPLLRDRCFFALDDTNHVKHHQSLRQIKEDPRFRILGESGEKFGFCIAEYNP